MDFTISLKSNTNVLQELVNFINKNKDSIQTLIHKVNDKDHSVMDITISIKMYELDVTPDVNKKESAMYENTMYDR